MSRIREVAPAARRITAASLPAGLLLLACYLLTSLLLDPGGYLGTDTGTKVHTLEVMEREATASPDIGYWAEDLDPSGSLHPLHQTRRQPDGSWVGVTTLPMLELGQPLYRLGGYRATLLLPMAGGVAAAFAARHLARRLRPGSTGWSAFWLVGLGSPVFVYSLDFWEHSAGVACVLWAVVVLLGVLQERPAWHAVAAGLLFGAGAVMRQEVLVYTLIATAVVCGMLLVRRRSVTAPLVAGVATVVGFAASWGLNAALESAVEGQSRAARSSGTASAAARSASASRFGERVEEGLQTLLGLVSGDAVVSALLGAGIVVAVLAAARAERRGDRTFAVACLAAVGAVYLADAISGLGFVPGLLIAFPLAIGGLLVGWSEARTATVAAISVLALPLVYAFQYLGGAAPQWGGRYTLASGLMLGVVGVVALGERLPTLLRGLAALSVLVTVFGVAWLVQRSHSVADLFEQVVAESEPVVISRQAFLIREGGAASVGRRWLSTENEAEFRRAVDIARTIGEDRFTVLQWDAPAPSEEALPEDVEEVSRTELSFADGTPVGLVTYRFTG